MLKAWATRNLQGFSEYLRALHTIVNNRENRPNKTKQNKQTKVSSLEEFIVEYSLQYNLKTF